MSFHTTVGEKVRDMTNETLFERLMVLYSQLILGMKESVCHLGESAIYLL